MIKKNYIVTMIMSFLESDEVGGFKHCECALDDFLPIQFRHFLIYPFGTLLVKNITKIDPLIHKWVETATSDKT